MTTVLDDGVFPIVGWAGPGGDLIRPDVMQGMAEAGFTVSHSKPNDGERVKALDIAAEAGVRLLLCDDVWHVGGDYKLTAARKRKIKKAVEEVREHPGLYAFHIRDEPHFEDFPALAETMDFMRELDPYHLLYVNHFPIRQTGWHAGLMEVFWRKFIEMCSPTLLTWDLYCIELLSDEMIAAEGEDKPWIFPKEKIWVKPWYFDNLEMVRTFGLDYGLPFWAFTMSTRHGAYPTPTEGHIRFQLMHDLAYGARGLQYFTYAHEEGLIDSDGIPTPTWDIAKKVNAQVHTWAPVLQKLTSVNVYHSGPVWSGTRALRTNWPDHSHLCVGCDGDPATIGMFRDDQEVFHVMVVNKNPCSPARITLKVNLDSPEVVTSAGKAETGQLDLFEVHPRTGKLLRPWPYGRTEQLIALSPGEGRLFRIDKDESSMTNF